ncbi:MAG: aspartate/glutamate racemase family protein [Hyphomicrobiales bacterium]
MSIEQLKTKRVNSILTEKLRIGLIHATPLAIEPIRHAFDSQWPEVELINLLEDSLSLDLAREGNLTPRITQRIVDLAKYIQTTGADALLYTCSAFGPAIEEACKVFDGPVLKPNEAMFSAAIQQGGRAALLHTFEPSAAPMAIEFEEMAEAVSSAASLTPVFVPDALKQLKAGNCEKHNQLIGEAARTCSDYDTILLAQFSMSKARSAAEQMTDVPILTSPNAAVQMLKDNLTNR